MPRQSNRTRPEGHSAPSAPLALWRLSRFIGGDAAGDGARVKLRGSDGGYRGLPGPWPAALPDVPAAVLLYNHDREAWTLVLDLDAKPGKNPSPEVISAARQAARRDSVNAARLLASCGGLVVQDYSPATGGRHVYVPLATPLTVEQARPLMRLLKAKFRTLDIGPMVNVRAGCITVPGSLSPAGGYRELVDAEPMDVVECFTLRSAPDFVERLFAELDPPQLQLPSSASDDGSAVIEGRESPCARVVLEEIESAGLTAAATLPPELVSTARWPSWIRAFGEQGVLPAGRAWSPSEARLSLLHHAALRGWSRQRTWAHMQTVWPAMAATYNERRDRHRRFDADWEKGFALARKRAAPRAALKSGNPEHKVKLTTHSGPAPLPQHLANARKWVLLCGALRGRERWTALLAVQALAHGMSVTRSRTVALGGRWLSVAGGLVSAEAVWAVLGRLAVLPGSPVRRLARASTVGWFGDEYGFVTGRIDGKAVVAAAWEAHAAKPVAVDPVWSLLGWSAWHIWHTMLAIDCGDTTTRLPVTHIAAAARVSADTVENALSTLAFHGLTDRGHGWARRTGRTPRQLGDLSVQADERRDERIARHQTQRAEWRAFLRVMLDLEDPAQDALLDNDIDADNDFRAWMDGKLAHAP